MFQIRHVHQTTEVAWCTIVDWCQLIAIAHWCIVRRLIIVGINGPYGGGYCIVLDCWSNIYDNPKFAKWIDWYLGKVDARCIGRDG